MVDCTHAVRVARMKPSGLPTLRRATTYIIGVKRLTAHLDWLERSDIGHSPSIDSCRPKPRHTHELILADAERAKLVAYIGSDHAPGNGKPPSSDSEKAANGNHRPDDITNSRIDHDIHDLTHVFALGVADKIAGHRS